MQPASHRRETGAVLVQTALLLVILMMFVGLAVDVGKLYAERRHMQNAADAGALAGARAICFGGDPVAEATDYAVTNGADSALVQITDGYKIRVVATRATDTHFMGLADLIGLVGIDVVNVSADATAACGVAKSACGLWPIAFRQDVWLRDCGQPLVIWDDEKTDVDCTVYDCDINGDLVDDVVVGGDRGWLGFGSVIETEYGDDCATGNGCSAADLKCRIRDDYPGKITLPACIPGASGVKGSAWQAAGERIGDQVRIPLYDSIGCETTSCPGGLPYHVVSFGCATVKEVTTLELPALDGTNKKVKGKVIIMDVSCGGCETNCGSANDEEPNVKDLKAVSLLD